MISKQGERLVISNSLRREFTRCRKRYWFSMIERLDPIVGAPPLRFGSIVHDCLQRFYHDKQVLFDVEIDRWAAQYIDEVNSTQEENEYELDSEKIYGLADLAKGMMRGYVDKWAQDLNEFEVLATELPFRFPLHVPCSKCKGAGCGDCGGTGIGRKSPRWDYVGKLDLVLRDKSGLVWIPEHKTTVNTNPDSYMNDLMLDSQPRGYIWAARKLAEENGWGPVRGIIYNVLRKKVPSEPATTQCKSCKGTGQPSKKALKEQPGITRCPNCQGTGVGGISRAATDTLLKYYLSALNRYPHIDKNDYAEIIQTLTARGNRFFWREWHHVPDTDVRDWLMEMYQITRDISTTGYYYRNLDACMVSGRKCPYRRICIEDNEMTRRNFKKRIEALPEIKAEEIGF